ncbi:MAG: EAL domain-containing protein [Candidatus Thiodiazotropha sp.]
MSAQTRQNRSLYGLLVALIVTSVVLVLGGDATFNYFMQRERMLEEMREDSALSMATLQQNLAGFMESYAVNEYEQLVATEIQLRHHFAILVTDYNMGRLLSRTAYVSGKIRDPQGQIIDYQADNPEHHQWLKTAFHTTSAMVLGSAGNHLGEIAIYTSDAEMKQALRQLLIRTLFNNVLILALLVLLLLLTIRRLLVHPLRDVARVLKKRDSDGLPTAPIPHIGYREIAVLTDTMNTMIELITASRQSLREERNRLANIIQGTQVGTWEWEVPTGRVILNDRWAEMLGYSLDELHPLSIKTWENLCHPKDLQRAKAQLERHFSGETPMYECEIRMHHKDGHWVWLLDRGRVNRYASDGAPECISGTHLDISDRKYTEERLRQSASVFEHAKEGIMITDSEGDVLDINEAFTQITGYHKEEVIGRNPRLLKSNRQSPAFYETMWKHLRERGQWIGEIWNRRKDGTLFATIETISAVRSEIGTLTYVALFSDITAIKEYQSRLERIAHYDPLTDLPNRVLLGDRLRQAMAQAVRHDTLLGIIYLDLDGFKTINDTHGHDVGDRLLKLISERMHASLRECDTLARIGGDEFVAVLMDLESPQSGIPIIERLHDATLAPLHLEGLELRVTASFGVTFYPQRESVDADQLMRQADQAMYVAKQAGKNRYHLFDSEQDQAVRGHFEELEQIRDALMWQQLVLHYQPKVDMRSGQVMGVEALIRWDHPQRGLLLPGSFLPAITNDKLMIEVGDWVIETAAAQVEAWRSQGLSIPVSVNIDGYQFAQADFIDKLKDCLQRHPSLQPGDLELEVLETSALDDIARISELIGVCEQLGIGFSLDDFGTGYSSLTYLKQLPARTLKIDRSFVSDMLEDPEDLAILEGVLGLADAFQRQAIAEGVETVAHGSMLLSLGCRMAQGYGIAKPMPAESVPQWIENWRPDPAWHARPRVNREDLPVLFSMVEHRHWINHLERYLNSDHHEHPPLDPHDCPFGNWLYKRGVEHYGGHPGMERIIALHTQTHTLAAEAMAQKQLSEDGDWSSRLDEIKSIRDEILSLMEKLVSP